MRVYATAAAGASKRAAAELNKPIGRTTVWDDLGKQYRPLEYLVSGSGLLNIYRALPTANSYPVVDSAALIAAIEHGSEAEKSVGLAALETWIMHLARAINNLRWLLDPHHIILGGGVIAAKHLWWSQLQAALKNTELPSHNFVLSPAVLGNDAGMIGAAKLAWQLNLGATAK